MAENERGELHPVINSDLCIGCGLCEKKCPELNNDKLIRNPLPDVYCCWLKDSNARKNSTSGGVGYAIACAIIEKGGHVWGAAYSKNLEPQYIEANTLDELSPIQKTKYVQCALNDSFKRIKSELDSGELVLFTGTGCHVKGLKSYLGRPYENLITVDLVCHGVPGQGIFRKYIEFLETRYNDKILSFDFRPKRVSDGQEMAYCSIANFKKIGTTKIEQFENSYFWGFQHNLFLRECCHNCQSNGRERYADITIADFWGLGKLKPFKKWEERTLGISMISLNSEKGKRLFNTLSDKLEYEQRSIEEACCRNESYIQSSPKSPRSNHFFEDYKELTWEQLSIKYFTPSLRERVVFYLHKYTPPIVSHMLKHWRK